MPEQVRDQARVLGRRFMEVATLVGPGTGEPSWLESSRGIAEADARFAQGQHDLSVRLVDYGYERGARLADAMTATELHDILHLFVAGCAARGLDPAAVLGEGRAMLVGLIEAMPSRWVTREMRRARHANRQQQWTRSDLNDVVALGVAVPYCHVVVTERQWVARLGAAGADSRFGTMLITDLRDLPEVLATAAA